MKRVFLGLDYGTGSCKGCLIDEEANLLAYANREYQILTPANGFSEHDARVYWPLTCQIIQECLEKAQVAPEQVAGIGTSSALPSLVMIGEDGEPLQNAYNLMDRRAWREKAELEAMLGTEKIYAVTKNNIADHPILVNLLWEKRNRPESFREIKKVLTIDGYIRYKLTGTTTAHYSAGVFYGVAYNLLEGRFEPEILEKVGIPAEILPDFCHCEDLVGEVTERAARETGLVPGIPVAGGQVDCNAGWVGAGAIAPGDIQLNLGTCGNFGVVHHGEAFMPEMFNFPYTTDSERTYVTVTTTMTGGQVLRYLKENFADLECAAARLLPDMDAYDMLNLEAERIPAGSEGLLVLPYLMGERTPIWDNDARGCVFGLSLRHGRAHLVRAMMEGVAYALYDSFRYYLDAGIRINYPIVMNEGGAKSRLWRRIITDVFNAPTVLVKNRAGAPYGDAVLAAVATGHWPDYAIAREKAEYVEPMEPIAKNHAVYERYFALYRALYQHVKTDYQTLAGILRG